MSQDEQQHSSLEQRFLAKREALFFDILQGNELIPTNYVLSPTQADFEGYYAELNDGTREQPTGEPGQEGLSPG